MFERRNNAANGSTKAYFGARVTRLLSRLREALLAAIHEESTRATEESTRRDELDLFEKLPDPPHLSYGEVRYFGGKLRYFDD